MHIDFANDEDMYSLLYKIPYRSNRLALDCRDKWLTRWLYENWMSADITHLARFTPDVVARIVLAIR